MLSKLVTRGYSPSSLRSRSSLGTWAWAGSGANPWHLDEDTESILFLTNESDQPARVGFKVSANGSPTSTTEQCSDHSYSYTLAGDLASFAKAFKRLVIWSAAACCRCASSRACSR